ncbi:DUF6153 family protein [Actinomycetospora sp. NBRC 106378]|uniref:DUF6153 family protein n=1 Tax=Actinomycetospora sp. NBRC 106378 TaxID=3032208 RepID=UPI0024A0527B|nr:DUF6153 family protein [Actinomycetospora sp. NBRC 106378]GLZ56038.1 hypothetical protein Acsp07_56550 [Actinomycetospora sp. NBRC 106378]
MIEHRGAPAWARALLVLALLAGLVGMHQLVAPTAHHGAATSVVALQEHGHEMPPGHTSMLAHLCLAVLVALATPAGALVVALLLAPAGSPRTTRGPTPVLAGPAPVPVPRRLAALQILRL